jgi:hypothetical protein
MAEGEQKRRRPHPFFAVYLVVVAAGVLGGFKTSATAPAWALGSVFVHRCEVGLAIGGALYLVSTVGWLAWQGRYLNLKLPGGLGGAGKSEAVDNAADSFDATAEGFNEYRKRADKRFKAIENALGNVVNRLDVLERRESPGRERRRLGGLFDKLRRPERTREEHGDGSATQGPSQAANPELEEAGQGDE